MMPCPHCGRELGTRNCPACGSAVLEESLFCHRCGKKLEGPPGGADSRVEEGAIDFSQRLLCSDGNCIGVINDQGVCKICGKPYTGEAK